VKTILTFLTALVIASLDAVANLALRLLPCAFDATNMNRIQAGTVTLWVYKTTDAIATVIASGYFNTHYQLVKENDIILCASSIGGVNAVDVLIVTSADGASTVTVTNGT